MTDPVDFEFESPPHPYVPPDVSRAARPAQASRREADSQATSERNGGPPPVLLADLLDTVMAFIRHYVVMTDEQAIAAALWAALTHAYEAFDLVPTSP